MRARSQNRGLTLLEVLISISVLALIATLIYGAFDGMSRSKEGLSRMNGRYHQGRSTLERMSRELQSAFLSKHQPLVVNQSVRTTVFIGEDSRPIDRIDFTSFSHRRLDQNAHESDQSEIGYFASRDPERDKVDLARREDKWIDLEPDKGGVVNVVAEDVESFDLQYLDPVTGEWSDTWDSTQPAGQIDRLPLQVKIILALNGGPGNAPITIQTKVPIAMQLPLTFALPR